jgi:DUF1365 family protein
MANIQSSIYAGLVMHHRLIPKQHRFAYRVFSLCLDLDELELLDSGLSYFSVNRFGLFSFYEKDHGRGGAALREEINDLLINRGYQSATARIELLCYPRILGYTFNPLSVYFCYNSDNHLEVILYEVSNTFNQRHSYLLSAQQDENGIVRHNCHKLMYVSPFMPLDTAYSFRILPPQDSVAVCIQQSQKEKDTETTILNATFTGQRRSLNDKNLIRLFFSHPMMTLKVITAIHWEALQLWLKGVRLQPREKGKRYSISWSDQNGVSHNENL